MRFVVFSYPINVKLASMLLSEEMIAQEVHDLMIPIPHGKIMDELLYRKLTKVVRLIRSAGLKAQASCENIDYTEKEILIESRFRICLLAGSSLSLNILIMGPT